MTTDRRLAVLRAIVQDYVRTSEPVGSKSLVQRHRFGVSAATVRNDMAVLEEEGLIHAPHTSAGRVPTDAGYRLFVDRLGSIRPLSLAQRAAIATFLQGAADLDDVVDRTVRLLSSLTQSVAVMQYPSLVRCAVQHVELVHMGRGRVMVVFISSTGRVDQRVTPPDPDLDADSEELLGKLRRELNAATVGRPLGEAATALRSLPERFEPRDRDAVRRILAVLDDVLVEDRDERVVMAGTANLARFGADFHHAIGPVLQALEEHVVLLKLFGSLTHGGEALAVRIGHENELEALAGASIVSTGYGPDNEVVAGLGVLGPTRMDYPTTMAYVRAVARYVSDLLEP